MQVITRSVIVDAPVDLVYEVSNRIDQWPEMIPEYLKAEILRREGRKIWFRLTNADNASWVSWRMLYPPLIAYAERYEPLAPFTFNHLTWVYQPLPGYRSQMTWDMCFELIEEHRGEEAQWRERMAEHTAANQEAMREYIESLASQPDTPGVR
ncbi:SRPBCC family protein [Nocardia sp. NPDC052566]|uniref:SRPBCC family protein n=1 Tax=Nocardia sp. NPDC052566 TaxID=3364330 RepID=UPI0037C8EE21